MWKIAVYDGQVRSTYNIDALTEIGARVKAFLKDGGGMCPDASGLIALAYMWTGVLERPEGL